MSTAGLMEPDVARKAGGGKKDAAPYVHPVPLTSSRDARQGEIVRAPAAIALRKAAHLHGWTAVVTGAVGTRWPPPGRAGILVHTCAMRLTRDHWRIAAVWHTPAEGPVKWKFEYASVRGYFIEDTGAMASLPFQLSSPELKALIKLEPTTQRLVTDQQYRLIEMVDRDKHLIPESYLREMIAPKKKGGCDR